MKIARRVNTGVSVNEDKGQVILQDIAFDTLSKNVSSRKSPTNIGKGPSYIATYIAGYSVSLSKRHRQGSSDWRQTLRHTSQEPFTANRLLTENK